MDVFVFRILAARVLGLNPERVSAKVISLRLQQVGWEILRAVTIIPGQGGAERRRWDAP